jgi:curved DNA-binding protein CbpA
MGARLDRSIIFIRAPLRSHDVCAHAQREDCVKTVNEVARDYYEVLQVSRNAHPLIIAKAYRLLVAFYHPDNQETGNKDHFVAVVEAYRVLSDPLRRVMYDRRTFGVPGKQYGESGDDAVRAFGRSVPAITDERELRDTLLQTLYTIRRNRSGDPGLSLMTLAELLGCSIESMQFTLWYLRGKKLIDTIDDGNFAITVLGVDWIEGRPEQNGQEHRKRAMQPYWPIDVPAEATSTDDRPAS